MRDSAKRSFLGNFRVITSICAATIVFAGCRSRTEVRDLLSENDADVFHQVQALGGTTRSPRNWSERTITLERDWKGGVEGVALLGGLQWVGELAVEYPAFDDEALAVAATFSHLTGLRLKYTQVSPQGLLALKKAPELIFLEIEDDPVTNEFLQSIKDADLRVLILHGNSDITDSGLAALRGMTNLVTLRLPGARITGDGFAKLDCLKEMRELSLANTPLEDRALRHFAVYGKLNLLDLSGTKVRGSGLENLQECSRLHELVLNDTAIGDHDLKALAGLTQLESLSLDRTLITDKGIGVLSRLSMLRTLSIRETSISSTGLRQFAALPNLVTVHIDHGDVVLFDEEWQYKQALPYAAHKRGKRLFLWTKSGLRQLQYAPPK